MSIPNTSCNSSVGSSQHSSTSEDGNNSRTSSRASHRSRRRRNRRLALQKTTQGEESSSGSLLQQQQQQELHNGVESARFRQIWKDSFPAHPQEERVRRDAMDDLTRLLAQWAGTLAASVMTSTSGMSRDQLSVYPTIVPFGSYRLGVHRPGSSDLDVLVIAPPHCSRNEFFTSFVELLSTPANGSQNTFTQIHAIPTAYTPVLKCQYASSLPMDMLFVSVADPTKLIAWRQQPSMKADSRMTLPQHLPPWQPGVDAEAGAGGSIHPKFKEPHTNEQASTTTALYYRIDDSDLCDQDPAGVRSLNGARVTQTLLDLVIPVGLERFQMVLLMVKAWARAQGVYSNVLGFWGGVNWAILVAYVCRAYPESSIADTVQLFFETFANWKWPTPVSLIDLNDASITTPPPGAAVLPSWNPAIHIRDGLHVCPILTPAYPVMNSSYNVALPQLRRMTEALQYTANKIARWVDRSHTTYNRGVPVRRKIPWHRLWSLNAGWVFRHQHYVHATIRAPQGEAFVTWFRLVESRLRVLISSLETPDSHAWPHGRFFYRNVPIAPYDELNGLREAHFFIGLRFASHVDTADVRTLTLDFLRQVNGWIGRDSSMDLSLGHVTLPNLPRFVLDEIAQEDQQQQLLQHQTPVIRKKYHETSPAALTQNETAVPSKENESPVLNAATAASVSTPGPPPLRDLVSPAKKGRFGSISTDGDAATEASFEDEYAAEDAYDTRALLAEATSTAPVTQHSTCTLQEGLEHWS